MLKGTHVFKRGIEAMTGGGAAPRFVSRATRLDTILFLNWALDPATLVFINTPFLLPSASCPLPFL